MPEEKRPTIWEQIVEKKASFIGGTLHEHDDLCGDMETEIVDIRLEPSKSNDLPDNFIVEGKDFRFMCNTKYLGMGSSQEATVLILRMTFAGGWWSLTEKEAEHESERRPAEQGKTDEDVV